MKLKGYLIAVDLDGTLITGFDNYDKKSFRLLRKLSKHNTVVIATGRPLRSSIYYYNLLKLRTPIVNYNGALVQNPTDSSFKKLITNVNREDLFRFLEDNSDIIDTVFCEIEDDIFLQKETDYIHPYLHSDGGTITIGALKDTLTGNPNGAIIFSHLNSEKRLASYIENEFKGRILIRFWYVNKVVVSEFYSPETSKANAISKIADSYQIPQDKIIAIGDGHNDIEMIQFAKYGVAMENAHPELIKVCTPQTSSVKDHGVYKFLKQFKKSLK